MKQGYHCRREHGTPSIDYQLYSSMVFEKVILPITGRNPRCFYMGKPFHAKLLAKAGF